MNIKEKLENLYLPNKKKNFFLFYIIITFVTVFFFLGITYIELDNDLTVLLPVNAETVHERETIKRLNKEFPSAQVILIGIKDAFNIDKIKILKNMCDELDKLPVIKSTMHPFNAAFFKKIGDTFSIQRSQPIPTTLDEMNVFVKNLSSNRYLVGSVISYDGQTAGIVVRIGGTVQSRATRLMQHREQVRKLIVGVCRIHAVGPPQGSSPPQHIIAKSLKVFELSAIV